MPPRIPPTTAHTQFIRPATEPLIRQFLFSLLMATMIAVGARVSFPLPFTDVPVSLQVFFVLLAGGMLGAKWGALSVVEYLAAGTAGIPVFAQGLAGPAVLLGPTGGYLIGFVFAAAIVGWATDRSNSRFILGLAMLAGILIIHLLGGLYWSAVSPLAHGPFRQSVFRLAILPFLAVDVLKAMAAWAVLNQVRRER